MYKGLLPNLDSRNYEVEDDEEFDDDEEDVASDDKKVVAEQPAGKINMWEAHRSFFFSAEGLLKLDFTEH